ncbi:hypothetical protein L8P05_24765 [Enterobacter cloacae]|uniref:hypothetical protein n=1 Tax=Enterobacter cloacae TaxID=550 RepID=UPI002004187A|nr:hypothetical protein [Enterobacter cloacae]MCK7177122.1 hypothetical protein [Enterobacter cloacae]
MNLSCPYNRAMTFAIKGPKSLSGELLYGRTGHVRLTLTDGRLDGKDILFYRHGNNEVLGVKGADSIRVRPGDVVTVVENGAAVHGKSLTVRMEVMPVMAERDARVTSELTSEGELHIELIE